MRIDSLLIAYRQSIGSLYSLLQTILQLSIGYLQAYSISRHYIGYIAYAYLYIVYSSLQIAYIFTQPIDDLYIVKPVYNDNSLQPGFLIYRLYIDQISPIYIQPIDILYKYLAYTVYYRLTISYLKVIYNLFIGYLQAIYTLQICIYRLQILIYITQAIHRIYKSQLVISSSIYTI